MEGVLDQTEGFGHPLHDAFRGGVWDILLKWEKESEDAALDHFMNHNKKEGKKIASPELAREVLRSYQRYKNAIYNYIPSEPMELEQMAKVREEHYKKCKGKDLEEARKAEFKSEKYHYYFKMGIPGYTYGDNLVPLQTGPMQPVIFK